MVDKDGSMHCSLISFIIGKCRNASPKRPTIPRLELMDSLMAVHLDNMVKNKLDWTIDSVTFRTDSITIIHYIKNETRRFFEQRFVATRLEEIH